MVIKQAVERLDNLEASYAQVLVRLGSMHTRNRDFCTENFAIFTDALLYIWKQRLQRYENAWVLIGGRVDAGLGGAEHFTGGFRSSWGIETMATFSK